MQKKDIQVRIVLFLFGIIKKLFDDLCANTVENLAQLTIDEIEKYWFQLIQKIVGIAKRIYEIIYILLKRQPA